MYYVLTPEKLRDKVDTLEDLQKLRMERIVVHWTGGSYVPSSLDKEHYHFLIDGDGHIHKGKFPISANSKRAGGLISGAYAAHIAKRNTGSIGIALCGMAGAKESPLSIGDFPLRHLQYAVLAELCADLLRACDLRVTPNTLFMHSEAQSGKWDITVFPDNLDWRRPRARSIEDAVQISDATLTRLRYSDLATPQLESQSGKYVQLADSLSGAVLRDRVKALLEPGPMSDKTRITAEGPPPAPKLTLESTPPSPPLHPEGFIVDPATGSRVHVHAGWHWESL